jgi:hypothetical protein
MLNPARFDALRMASPRRRQWARAAENFPQLAAAERADMQHDKNRRIQVRLQSRGDPLERFDGALQGANKMILDTIIFAPRLDCAYEAQQRPHGIYARSILELRYTKGSAADPDQRKPASDP